MLNLTASSESDTPDQQTARPTASTAGGGPELASCPVRHLRADVLPQGESLKKLHAFFQRYQPLDPKELGTTEAEMWQQPEHAQQCSSREQGYITKERKGEVKRVLRSLFEMCVDRCICQEQDCIFRSGATQLEGDPSPSCLSRNCEVCSAFKVQKQTMYITNLQSKNGRLNQLLCCCPGISEMYMYRMAKYAGAGVTTERANERKRQVQELLCKLVLCNKNKLNCMKNLGDLAEVVPRILCVQLTSGHSEFWTELRKVAKAVVKQHNLECKLAALIAIRKHIPPGNLWSQYLVSDHSREEADILQKWTSALQT